MSAIKQEMSIWADLYRSLKNPRVLVVLIPMLAASFSFVFDRARELYHGKSLSDIELQARELETWRENAQCISEPAARAQFKLSNGSQVTVVGCENGDVLTIVRAPSFGGKIIHRSRWIKHDQFQEGPLGLMATPLQVMQHLRGMAVSNEEILCSWLSSSGELLLEIVTIDGNCFLRITDITNNGHDVLQPLPSCNIKCHGRGFEVLD